MSQGRAFCRFCRYIPRDCGFIVGSLGALDTGQVLASVDIKPQAMQCNRLHEATLNRRVYIERRRCKDRPVLAVKDRMPLSNLAGFVNYLR